MNYTKTLPNAIEPTKATSGSAGFDLYSPEYATIKWRETTVINTGICIEIPKGCVGLIFARSGLATKHGIRPANCVGVIDSDYRGEIKVALFNDSDNDYTIKQGDRIAQLVITIYPFLDLKYVDSLEKTDRGNGGFGSTGE